MGVLRPRPISNGMSDFAKKVYSAVKKIPHGQVSTYKDVAKVIGSPRAFRAVGGALNKNYSSEIPCHRVVCSNGKAGGYNRGGLAKVKILQREGVKIENGQIPNLNIFRWNQTKSLR